MNRLRLLISARYAVFTFSAGLLAVYAFLPAALFVLGSDETGYPIQLAAIALFAVASIFVGYSLPLFDARFRPDAPRFYLSRRAFHGTVWTLFVLFAIYTVATAPEIPLVSAIRGASATELSLARGNFLKAREGAEIMLIYISTIFVAAILPYSLGDLYAQKSRMRFVLTLVFLLYSISFLQKALFINVLIPLFYVYVVRAEKTPKLMVPLMLLGVALLLVVSKMAAGQGEAAKYTGEVFALSRYFSAKYLPVSVTDHLIWRSVAVPLFTAVDTLLVHAQELGGELLMGATSSLFALAMSVNRVPLEKMVFAYEWGWNDIANSNAVYMLESHVNFGWIGVAVFSMLIGQTLRCFALSRDGALRSLWLIFCFSLFTGGALGTYLSNGYLAVLFYALFMGLRPTRHRPVVAAQPGTASA